jgi:hypothetical protein
MGRALIAARSRRGHRFPPQQTSALEAPASAFIPMARSPQRTGLQGNVGPSSWPVSGRWLQLSVLLRGIDVDALLAKVREASHVRAIDVHDANPSARRLLGVAAGEDDIITGQSKHIRPRVKA